MTACPAHRLSISALFALVLLGCAQAPATTAETPAKPPFEAAEIAKGAQLSAIGDCRECHTTENGAAFAGGRPLPTPFGTIHSTNITPDEETGIGAYTREDFRRALREGIARDGHRLYPVFPYDHFTRVTDDDVDALYAFAMTRSPVKARAPANRVRFPANVRPLLAAWNALFLDDRRFAPDPAQSAQWNRGAYLVEGLAHCGACHTPRNAAGAERKDARLEGGEAEGWEAPGLLAASPAPVEWSAERLYRYLREGFDGAHGIAAGPMAPVVDGLASVPESDVRAIVAYLTSLPQRTRALSAEMAMTTAAQREFDPVAGHAPDRAPETGPRTAQDEDAGAIIFAGACASCHFAGVGPPDPKPVPLAVATSVNASAPRNALHVVLEGLQPKPGESGAIMPGFAGALTDRQVVAVVEYMRARFSDGPRWTDVAATLADIEKEDAP
ncbi:MAG TPA: cytochrome c [Casimicrobiaceae bacterium]|nr:cytochrome c [Casimicrobiaceae bacterium]